MFARSLPTLLVTGLVGLTGCKKLPDTVPYEASIMMKGHGDDSLFLLVGGDLLLDGEKIASIERLEEGHILSAKWSGPKADVRAVLEATYTIGLPGACGALSLKTEGPNELWRTMSESKLAENVESDGAVPIFITPQMPTRHDLLVDWGSGTHEVVIGEQTLAPGKEQYPVFLDGCTAPPPVKVDGKEVGTLDLKSPVHLVSTEATRCHQIREIQFGEGDEPLAATVVTKAQVTPLEWVPYYVFEAAPDVLQVPEGIDGTSVKELTGVPCAGAAEKPEPAEGEADAAPQ